MVTSRKLIRAAWGGEAQLLRSPSGGYRHAATSAAAASGVFTMGQMMPEPFQGTRAISVSAA